MMVTLERIELEQIQYFVGELFDGEDRQTNYHDEIILVVEI